eukprot:scaffold28845_cov123-Isochrysis_galbana.AAC.1
MGHNRHLFEKRPPPSLFVARRLKATPQRGLGCRPPPLATRADGRMLRGSAARVAGVLLAACSAAAINVEGNVAGVVTAVEGAPPARRKRPPATGTSACHARAGSAVPLVREFCNGQWRWRRPPLGPLSAFLRPGHETRWSAHGFIRQ